MKQTIGMYFLFLFGLNFTAPAQDSVRQYYVREFPGYFHVKLFATDRILGLNIHQRNGDNRTLNYQPNDRGYIGIGAYIFDINVALSAKVPKSLERDPARFGNTEFTDFQGNIYGRKWNVDLIYQKYKGFYLKNAGDILPDFNAGDVYPQREDLAVRQFLLNVIRVFQPEKFSFRSGFIQADRQIKSAGSLLLLNSFHHFTITADSSLTFGTELAKAQVPEDGRLISVSLLPGYAYNFVYKSLYLSLMVNGGAGIQHQEYLTEEGQKIHVRVIPDLNFRAALGFDNDRFFAGISFVYDTQTTRLENFRISSASGNYQISIGYRIREFGILKKFSFTEFINRKKDEIFGD